MKLLSRSTAELAALQIWSAPELGAESGSTVAATRSEQLRALFEQPARGAPHGQQSSPRTALHRPGRVGKLDSWLPGEINRPSPVIHPEAWEFVETSVQSFRLAEPEAIKNKSNVEREKIRLLQEARLQAEAIVQAAQAEAAQLLRQAQDESEGARRDGFQAGWQSAQAALRSALAATQGLVHETRQWQSGLLQEGERILVSMLKELAQTMFGEGVTLDEQALQINLNRIMESAQRLGDLNIFLSPQDANLLDASWREYQLLITGNKVRLIPSAKIKPGGCIIKGSMGMVDARVETQLAAILDTMDELNEAPQ